MTPTRQENEAIIGWCAIHLAELRPAYGEILTAGQRKRAEAKRCGYNGDRHYDWILADTAGGIRALLDVDCRRSQDRIL